MKLPIYLQTKAGLEFYKKIHKEFDTAKQSNALTAFFDKYNVRKELVSRELTEFLYDDTMSKQYNMDEEDSLGWAFYKETSDQYAVLNYFTQRKS